jgi:hypothetical protein
MPLDFSDLIPQRGSAPPPLAVQSGGHLDFDDLIPSQGEAADSKGGPPSSFDAGDIAKSGGVGVLKGIIGLAGLPGDVSHLGAQGLDVATRFMQRKLGLPESAPYDPNSPTLTGYHLPGGAELQSDVEQAAGPFYQPKTTAGKYAQTIGEFAPAAVGGPEGLASKLIGRVAIPGAASEAAGQATEGTALEPYARIAGAVAGAGAPALIGRAISPMTISPARQAAVNTLENEGVNSLTAGQVTGSRPLQWFEQALSDMPMAGGGAGRASEQSAEQFTRAALQRVGENADRATPDVIDRAFTRIGNQFDTIAARNNITADGQLGQELRQVQTDYNFLANPMQRQVVDGALNDVVDVIHNNNGVLPGDQYQAMRSRLDRAARAAQGNDNQLSDAMFGIRNALDDNMQRSLAATGNGADAQAWTEARRQYRDMFVIEKAATGAGENAANGLISPSQLRNAVVNQGRRAYARGQGDFADLARAGEAVMRPLPQSGTAPRANVQHVGGGLAAVIGGLVGGSHETAALGAAALAGPSMLGRTLMSRPAQAYLRNQVAAPLRQQGVRQNLLRGAVMSAASQGQ